MTIPRGMTAGCLVMLPSAAYLGLPVTPLLAGSLSRPPVGAVWGAPSVTGVSAGRGISEGVTSPPLSADDVTALRCDSHNFVMDSQYTDKTVSDKYVLVRHGPVCFGICSVTVSLHCTVISSTKSEQSE